MFCCASDFVFLGVWGSGLFGGTSVRAGDFGVRVVGRGVRRDWSLNYGYICSRENSL